MSGLEFHPEALAELESAVGHYEQQQTGLGTRFAAVIETAIGGIMDAPMAWPVLEGEVRRKLARVFPYAILYSVEADGVLVLAVMHCHQRPGYWRSRVGA